MSLHSTELAPHQSIV